MGCEISTHNRVDDVSSTTTESDLEKGGVKQRLFLIPRDPIQYNNQPPSVQKFLNPTRYKRDDEVYINRTIEPDVVGERIQITDEEKPVLYQLEKERRQKVWEYLPGVEIPKYRKNEEDRWNQNTSLPSKMKSQYTHLKPDMNCFLCGVYTNTKTYPCRVCLRSFHDACLQKFGKLDPVSRALMVNQAETEEGWSCFNCDNLVLELFEDEVAELQQLAHKCNLNPETDTDITKEEYIEFRSKQFESEKVVNKISDYEEIRAKQETIFELYKASIQITEEEEIRAKQEFWILDSKKTGSLGMRDFLNHEAIKKLAKRPQKDLVNLLSEKEIYDLEMTFRELDKDGDGMITAEEAQLVYTRWLKNLLVVSEGILPRTINAPIFVDDERKIGDATQAPVVQGADRGSGYVTWQEYLLDQAIYALASRLNKPAVHVVVNELEMKKPAAERKVVFAADNENIRIMHALKQAQIVQSVDTVNPDPFRQAAGLPVVTDESDLGHPAPFRQAAGLPVVSDESDLGQTEQVLIHR